MHLTTLERDVIKAIAENQYSDEPGDKIWSWAIEYHTKITLKKQIPGVVSSLVKKGLVISIDGWGKDDDTVQLTEDGVKVYNSIKES